MKKKLDSDTHKMRRNSAKFQRGDTKEQRKNLVKVLSEKKESKEKSDDDLLLDVFEILERSGYGEHSPVHMEMYSGDYLSIAFGYQTAETAKNNYENIVDFLKDTKLFKVKKESDTLIEFESGYFKSIRIDYKEGSSSLVLNGLFTDKQIKKGIDEYRWFSRSREKYEEENRRYNEEYNKRCEKDYWKRYEQRLNKRNRVGGEEGEEEE